MAKDNSVAGLYLRLRLNYDDLNQDFIRVEETLSSNIQRINRQSKLISLKAAVDLTGVIDPAQRLKIEQEKLTRLIEIQTQKVKVLESAWVDAGKSNGYASKQAQSAAIALKQQELSLARLNQQLKEVTDQQNHLHKTLTEKTNFDNSLLGRYTNIKGNVSEHLNNLATAFSGITTATSSADAAISKSLEIIGNIPSPVGKAVAALASIPLIAKGVENSLLDMAKPAIAAGDALYVMSRGMQTSIADAAKLNMICKVTGLELNEVNSSVRRLSTQLNKAGEKDNAAKQMLERFGANVYDSNGQVKNELALIDELSKALLRAEKVGQGAAFRDIVGGKFWSGDFITFLEDYAGNVELASKVVKNGLANPALAHEVQGNLNAMNAQIGQFNSALSSAFMPATQYIVPELTAQFGELTRVIARNADGIKNVSMSIGELVVDISKVTTEITKLAAESTKFYDKNIQKAASVASNAFTENAALKPFKIIFSLLTDTNEIPATAASSSNLIERALTAARTQIAQNETLTEESLKRIQDYVAELEKIHIGIDFRNSGYDKSIAELELWHEKAMELADGHWEEQRSIDELYAAKLEQIELDKESKIAEIRERTAHLSRNDLENALANVEKEKDAWIGAGMEESEALALAEKQKSVAIRKLNDEWADHINSIYQTSLDQRLAQIEKEKQAWIQKGIDEVAATRAAEQQKVDARREAAMSIIRTQLKELEIFNKGGYNALQSYKLKELVKTAHVNPRLLRDLTPQMVEEFQAASRVAERALLPNFMTEQDKADNLRLREQYPNPRLQRQSELDELEKILQGITVNGETPQIDLEQFLSGSISGFTTNIDAVSTGLSELTAPISDVTERLNDLSGIIYELASPQTERHYQRGDSQQSSQPVNITVNVSIDEAHAWDSEHIQELADKVADEIQPEIVNAIGGDSNRY